MMVDMDTRQLEDLFDILHANGLMTRSEPGDLSHRDLTELRDQLAREDGLVDLTETLWNAYQTAHALLNTSHNAATEQANPHRNRSCLFRKPSKEDWHICMAMIPRN